MRHPRFLYWAVVCIHGILADPDKVKSVKEWPISRCRKDWRQFLEIANYLHKCSKNYAEKTNHFLTFLKRTYDGFNLDRKKREKKFIKCQRNFGGHTSIDGWLIVCALANSLSV